MFGKDNRKILRVVTGIMTVILIIGMILLYTPIAGF
jgi:hypothetical protein